MTLTYGVIDTETTGMSHEEDRLVEIAVVRSDGTHEHTLVSPGDRRISFGAMATHHITPDMVAEAPVAIEALWALRLGPATITCSLCDGTGEAQHSDGSMDTCPDCEGDGRERNDPDWAAPDMLVFHNAEFDRGFLPEYLRELPYICTWRCSLHLYPRAESHSNGALWYELGLSHPMPEEAGRMPHRALFDALMTRDILEHMVAHIAQDAEAQSTPRSRDEILLHLADLTQQPVLLTKCRFGKHRDELWENIPTSYMNWVLTQDFDRDTLHTCRHWLQERGRG